MSGHEWELMGGDGGWEVWECTRCGRRATPLLLGWIWPWPRCTGHPEDRCHRCHGPNVPWWAPSPVWNAVMGYPDQDHDGIVCPSCFVELAEARGAKGPWRFAPRVWPEGVSLVHVDGRVWDTGAERWVEP